MDREARDHDPLDELTRLADELLSQASEVRRQWAELGETLGIEPPEPAPRPSASAASPPADGPWPNADPARLVALDMMLSGRSREEVSEYLHATFGDEVDPAMLDEIFSEQSG